MRRALEELVAPGDGVLVAVSGGSDSMGLLHLMAAVRADLSILLKVGSINHGLRKGVEAELALVRALAEELGLEVIEKTIPKRQAREAKRQGSIQEWARNARYRLLVEIARSEGLTLVATAHTLDDQAETLMLRLLRGTGLEGLHSIHRIRALDSGVSAIRPLLGVGLMLLWAGDFRTVFWYALIPAVIAVLLLVFGVREPGVGTAARKPAAPIEWQTLAELGGAYWFVVAAGAVFTLARFSEAFLILRAQQQGLPDSYAPMVLVVMNLVYALSAYPLGRLADRLSHMALLATGLVTLIVADLVLGAAQGLAAVALGVALWGLHLGMTQGLLATMVAGTAPDHMRGTAFGFFNLASGVAMLIASVLAGLLWERLGPGATFHAGAVFALVAVLLLGMRKMRAPGA